MDTLLRELRHTLRTLRRHPTFTFGASLTLADGMAADLKPALAFFAGAVAFLLLIVYANLANLILAQGLARQRERTIRAALGTSRRDLLRHQVTEALVVAVPGAVLGLMSSVWLVNIVRLACRAFGRWSQLVCVAHTTGGTVSGCTCRNRSGCAALPQSCRTDYGRPGLHRRSGTDRSGIHPAR